MEMFLAHAGITDAQKRKIMWDNGARLFGLSAQVEAPVAAAD
jgi:predicted TIM-barrel fold metal-dependent hydrolase